MNKANYLSKLTFIHRRLSADYYKKILTTMNKSNIEQIANIFALAAQLQPEELFEPLVSTKDLLIERIISTGQTTPLGQWYDQDRDEWVILLQGKAQITYDDGSIFELSRGDYLLIPARQRHRVDYTSCEPPCIWLAVHGSLINHENTAYF